LQVEHPITEMISGIDIVREQIRSPRCPWLLQADISFWARDRVRINARTGDVPAFPGRVTIIMPGRARVRVDSALYHGYEVLLLRQPDLEIDRPRQERNEC